MILVANVAWCEGLILVVSVRPR